MFHISATFPQGLRQEDAEKTVWLSSFDISMETSPPQAETKHDVQKII